MFAVFAMLAVMSVLLVTPVKPVFPDSFNMLVTALPEMVEVVMKQIILHKNRKMRYRDDSEALTKAMAADCPRNHVSVKFSHIPTLLSHSS